MSLSFNEAQQAQSAPGFDLAKAAQAATLPAPSSTANSGMTAPIAADSLNSSDAPINLSGTVPPTNPSAANSLVAGAATYSSLLTPTSPEYTAEKSQADQ